MPTVVKVGLNPKKPTHYKKSLDLAKGLLTIQIVENWLVEWDSPQPIPTYNDEATDGTNTVPTIGADYEGVGIAWCNDVFPQLEPNSGGKIYNCQLTYQNIPPAPNTGVWDVKVRLNGVPVTETMFFDLDNNQVANTADQNFSNQPAKTYYDERVEVSFKTASWDEDACEALQGQINSDDVTLTVSPLGYTRTFPATTLRLDVLETEPVVQAGVLAHWQITETFTFRAQVTAPANCQAPGGGGSPISGSISTLEYDLVVDQGFAYYDNDGNFLTFKGKDGLPMNSPCLLDGTGGDGRVSGSPGPNDAVFLAFRVADRGDFSPLFDGIS